MLGGHPVSPNIHVHDSHSWFTHSWFVHALGLVESTMTNHIKNLHFESNHRVSKPWIDKPNVCKCKQNKLFVTETRRASAHVQKLWGAFLKVLAIYRSMYPHRAAAATALLALYCVLAENEKVVVERNSFLTPKSNNELFKNRVLAKTDYLTKTLYFGQNTLFWPKLALLAD